MRNQRRGSAIATTFLLAAALVAHAQEPPLEPSPGIEEVLITAQKREQRLQDVPISVIVTSGDDLVRQNLNRLEDLTQQVPNVHVSRGTISDQLTMRGVGSGNNPGFEQSVGTFVDGIYHGRGHTSQSTFVDIERVEVLRGPQSIYFGNNAIGGAFSVTTRKPTDTWQSQVFASYEFEAREQIFEASTGGPLTDTLGLRVAARYSDMDGYLENLGTGQRNAGIEDRFVRATMVWQPSELWTTSLKAEYGKQDSIAPVPVQMTNCPPSPPFPAPAGSCIIAIANDVETELDYRRTSNPGEYGFLETKEFVLSADRGGDGVGFSSILGYSEYDYMVTGDTDGTATSFFAFSSPEQYDQTSLELRLTSPDSSRLAYIFGLYGLRGNLDSSTVNALYLVSGRASTTVPALAPYTPLGRLARLDQEETTYSAFGALTWPFNDKFSATAGLRWTQVKKDGVQSSDAVHILSEVGDTYELVPQNLQAAAGAFVGSVQHRTEASRTDDDLIPSVNVQYKPTPDVSFYASYSGGFKAGGFDATEATGVVDRLQFNPESVEAYEIGMKSFLLDRDLALNIAIFNSEYTDLQQAVAQFTATTAYIRVTNVGSLRSRGVELDMDWQLGDAWRFGVNAAWLDAKYLDYANAGCTATQTLLTPPGQLCVQDLTGRPPPFAPEYSGSARLGYRTPIGSQLEFSADAVLSFSDSYHTISFEDPVLEQGAWEKIDLRLGLGSADGKWEVAVLGRNLADELTVSLANNAVGSAGTYWRLAERGRQYAVQFRWSWD